MDSFFEGFTDGPDRDELVRVLWELYGEHCANGPANLEEVLAYLDMSADYRSKVSSGEKLLTNHYTHARQRLVDVIQDVLRIQSISPPAGAESDGWADTLEGKTDPHHDTLFKDVLGLTDPSTAANSIITVNYDLVADYSLRHLEETAWALGEIPWRTELASNLLDSDSHRLGRPGPMVRPEDLGVGPYLKLHGSLHWLYCPNENCPSARGVLVEYPPGSHRHGLRVCRRCGTDVRLLLVPPSLVKDLDRWPGISLQWRLAVRMLQEANRLIIVGVSFAPSDVRLAWLMQYGLNAAVTWGVYEGTTDFVHMETDPTRRGELERRVIRLLPASAQNKIRFFPRGFADYVSGGSHREPAGA